MNTQWPNRIRTGAAILAIGTMVPFAAPGPEQAEHAAPQPTRAVSLVKDIATAQSSERDSRFRMVVPEEQGDATPPGSDGIGGEVRSLIASSAHAGSAANALSDSDRGAAFSSGTQGRIDMGALLRSAGFQGAGAGGGAVDYEGPGSAGSNRRSLAGGGGAINGSSRGSSGGSGLPPGGGGGAGTQPPFDPDVKVVPTPAAVGPGLVLLGALLFRRCRHARP